VPLVRHQPLEWTAKSETKSLIHDENIEMHQQWAARYSYQRGVAALSDVRQGDSVGECMATALHSNAVRRNRLNQAEQSNHARCRGREG
jgi:hypothetical protein